MEIGEYLDGQRAEGTSDSEGVFTLNLARALQQMGELAANQPYEFALRAIQAGVAAGAPALHISITRHRLAISHQEDLGDIEDLLVWLTGAQAGLSRAQSHMAAGLALAPEEWTLRSGVTEAQRRGAQISTSVSSRPDSGFRWEVSLSGLEATRLREEVSSRTRYSPVPIIVDGLGTFGPWLSDETKPPLLQLGDPSDLFCSLTFAEQGGFTLPSLPMKEMEPMSEGFLWSGCRGFFRPKTAFVRRRPAWFLRLHGTPPAESGRWRLSRAIRRPLYDTGRAMVTFIIDGVRLPYEELERTSNLEVLEHADWATTDLSGRHLVRDEQHEKFLQSLQDEIAQLQGPLLTFWQKISPVRKGKAANPSQTLSQMVFQGLGLVTGTTPCEEFHAPFLGKDGRLPLARFDYHGHYLALRNGNLEYLKVYPVDDKLSRYHISQAPPMLPIYEIYYDNETAPTEVCLAMPIVNDPTFEDVRWRISRPRQFQIAARIVEGLACLHPTIGHGNLTPDHILIGLDDTVRFQNAAVAWAENRLRQRMAMVNTNPSNEGLVYVAPEEVSGNLTDPIGSIGSDFYKVGIVLRETLVGEPTNLGAGSVIEYLYKVLHEPSPDVTLECPQYSEELTGLVSRMLQKEPRERTVDLNRLAFLLREAAEKMESQISSENS